MERRWNNTTTGAPQRTSTPGYTSSPSLGGSPISLEEDGEEEFQWLMDESGIIGLEEMNEEDDAVERTEHAGTPEPEVGPPPAEEDLSYHLSELLDSEPLSRPTGDERISASYHDDDDDDEQGSISLDVWSDEETKEGYRPTSSKLDTMNLTGLDERNHGSSSRSTPHPQVLPCFPQLTSHQFYHQPELFTDPPPSLNPAESDCSRPRTTHQEPGPAPLFAMKPFEIQEETAIKLHHRPSVSPLSPQTPEVLQFSRVVPPPHNTSSASLSFSASQHKKPHSYRFTKTSHTDPSDVRRGQLNHTIPDFSKVEPRVRFPKSSYKPPKRQGPPQDQQSFQPGAPIVYRSPADIVREVLLVSSDGISDDSEKPPSVTLSQELHCPLQASAMVLQLQEDYNKLLTKYAAAENTIDRLRLEAKVRLHSELPKPNQLIHSGVLKEGSKVMTLSFPQAQRAELVTELQPTERKLGSDSVSSRWSGSLFAAQPTETLANQVHRFQLQIKEFEKLSKTGKLQLLDQMEGLSQLTQGQEAIEKAYLTAREQHRQQMGGNNTPFDPERELEGLIFQSALNLEELREWMEQSVPAAFKFGPAPCPSSPALQPCVSLNETEPQPENLVAALHPKRTVGLEASSFSGGGDGNRGQDEEEMIPSAHRPLMHKPQRLGKDFCDLMNHLPSANSLSDSRSMETPPEAPLPTSALPGQPDSGRRAGSSSKSHSNLNGGAATRGMSKGSGVTSSQDGVTSPETDSGFVGSESGRLTLVAQDCVQQRAAMRANEPSVTQAECEHRPGPGSLHGDSNTRLPSHTPPPSGHFGDHASASERAAGSSERRREAGKRPSTCTSPSSSPQCRPSSPVQPWTSSVISELQSEGACSLFGAEAQQSGEYTRPANKHRAHHTNALYSPHHDDTHPKDYNSFLLTNQREAFQALQTEVDRLTEHLERSLRTSSPNRREIRSRGPPRTSTPPQRSYRSLERKAAGWREPSQENEIFGVEKRQRGSMSRRRSASVPRLKPALDITTDSHPFEPKNVSFIPEHLSTPYTTQRWRTGTDQRSKPHRDHQPCPFPERSQMRYNDADRSTATPPLCPNCSTGRRILPTSTVMGFTSGFPHPVSNCCPLCGVSEPNRDGASLTVHHNSSRRESQPASSRPGPNGGVYLAVAPPPPVLSSVPVVQYVPVYSSVLYYNPLVASSHQTPHYLPLSKAKEKTPTEPTPTSH